MHQVSLSPYGMNNGRLLIIASKMKPKIKHYEAEKESTWLITVESIFSFEPLVQSFYKTMIRKQMIKRK